MLLPILCKECSNDERFQQIELTDSIEYDVLCKNGHRQKLFLSTPKYEILFQAGIEAIKAGFYSEAIINFATCLERFYEFGIQCLLLNGYKGYEDFKEQLVQFEMIWKPGFSSKSEKQMGGFLILYLQILRKAPPYFEAKFAQKIGLSFGNKITSPVHLRNEVAHKGYIATYNQAVSYGECVFQYCKEVLVEFHNSLRPAFDSKISKGEFIIAMAEHMALERLVPDHTTRFSTAFPVFLHGLSVLVRERLYKERGGVYSLLDLLPLKP